MYDMEGMAIDWRASGIRTKWMPRNKSNKLSLDWQVGTLVT